MCWCTAAPDPRDDAARGERMSTVSRIKVLDLSTHFSGAVASRHLAHFGADVVKVENPRIGDGNRGLEPLINGGSMAHVALNAGKRSIAVDRRSPQWEEILTACTRWADVVIVGAQPGAAGRRKMDFKSFVARNPNIIYCLISGYGETGPWRDYPSHGLNGDAPAGLVPVEVNDGVPSPRRGYKSVGTTLAGIHAALGILEGLRRRDQGGGAQRVSVSVWQSAMGWQWREMTTFANLGIPHRDYRDLGSRYAMYRTSDDRVVLVCPIERKFWESFCDVAGLPAALKGEGSWETSGMDWGKGRDAERALIAARIRTRPLSEWCATFDAAGIPYSPLLTLAEAIETEQAKAVGVMATTIVNGKEVRIANVPIHIGGIDATSARTDTVPPPPALGEHTETFLHEVMAKP